MPEHWKASSTAGTWQFPEAAVTGPVLAKESAKLIFQGFPQLHFVGNQFPQWDVIHCDWAAKTVFITLPCPFFICIPHITRSVKVWCLNQMRAWTSWLGLRCKNSVYTHLHYLKNPQFWLGFLVDHPFQNRKVMTVSFQVQSRFKPACAPLKEAGEACVYSRDQCKNAGSVCVWALRHHTVHYRNCSWRW